MNKKFIYALAAVVGGLALASLNLSAEDPKLAAAGGEYITIQYSRTETHVLFPNGKAEFFPEIGNASRPERTDERVYVIHTLINKYSSLGYEYVDAPDATHVLMRKRSR